MACNGVNMTGLEIFLVILGLIVVIGSFLFSEHLESKKTSVQEGISDSTIAAVSKEKIKEQIDETVNNLIDDTVERTEVLLDKTSNEKMIAISEYSDKVLEEINKTHNEVMFLYNMLNDKEHDIKNTIKEIDRVKFEASRIVEEQPKMVIEDKAEAENNLRTQNEYAVPISEENEQQGNNNELILQMAKQDKSIMQIAKELGLGIGEVRLVIDLYNASK